ncbi:MAG TPA: CDP-alcohol phosphatidyltransferase family protein [Sphingomonas sp.]|jgi:phosphatidylglycerophosphate synthase|uniref:CDP-alcohol phosphatidyltransferase family protein n=1 Tax=Sphingomonas sp. TaxID=28214 RepID=UPI002ED9FF74
MTTTIERPRLVPVGDNATRIWGMTNAERLRRIARAQKLDGAERPAEPAGAVLLANLDYAFDPNWTTHLARLPDTMVTRGDVPVLAHVIDPATRRAVEDAMLAGTASPATGLRVIAAEDEAGILNEALRKRERPFAERLVPENIQSIERASYQGAYKGVTDLLTKYLWPEWAFALTRLAARIGVTPNGVTALGTLGCVLATVAFWYGWFWTGLAVGLAFMVLDTVDGKLARCTITSSAIGNIWDHGIDLVHPPFWWWAWAVGCAPYGRPLDDGTFWIVMATMIAGYVAQRVIEGAFMRLYGMHIHVWERFDSRFRLVTARRNPNMVILFASLLIGRPDWGIVAVAGWTLLSLIVHFVRLLQAFAVRARGGAILSWLV